jgi:TonB family protein
MSRTGRPERCVRTAGIAAGSEPLLDLRRAFVSALERSAPAASRQRGPSLGLLLSLALHLLPLLLLVQWQSGRVEVPPPIPVQLVLEQPPPPPPPVQAARPEPAITPPSGRLASEEIGPRAEKPSDDSVPQPSETQAEKPSDDPVPLPSETQADAEPDRPPKAEPEPELRQVASLVQPQQQPTLLDRAALALAAPVVEPLSQPPAPARQPTPRPRPPQRAAAAEGLPAMRDEYLAYLVTLVRPHLPLLSPEIIRGRRGKTSLAILVLGDGTIARISVSESSGYPDIDARVVQIVAAVGRFPPLPPWVDQPSWEINFHLSFPFPAGGSPRP